MQPLDGPAASGLLPDDAAAAASQAAALATLRGPLVVVAHDAGGAEILSSLLRLHPLAQHLPLRLVLDGPARAVFERKLGPQTLWPLADALTGAGSVLCGTGWMGDLEWHAMVGARTAGVPSVAFLDHWVNYRERFVRQGRLCLPDEVWVGDAPALARVHERLPEVPARLVPNPYFCEARTTLAALVASARPHAGGARVLYLCEPMREPALRQFGNPRHHGYTEEEALDHALQHLPGLLGRIDSVVLRPHPSEAPDKYDAQLAASGLPGRRGGQAALFDEIAAADVVVGCNSVAMVVGLLAGKQVVCAIPPGGAPCVLPLPGIVPLRAGAALPA